MSFSLPTRFVFAVTSPKCPLHTNHVLDLIPQDTALVGVMSQAFMELTPLLRIIRVEQFWGLNPSFVAFHGIKDFSSRLSQRGVVRVFEFITGRTGIRRLNPRLTRPAIGRGCEVVIVVTIGVMIIVVAVSRVLVPSIITVKAPVGVALWGLILVLERPTFDHPDCASHGIGCMRRLQQEPPIVSLDFSLADVDLLLTTSNKLL